MDRYDLVVVGGGPAGGSCAYFAAMLGLNVCVVEKKRWIGLPVCCAEGISKKGLENIFRPKPIWISSLVKGTHLYAPSGRKITIHHPDAGYILERRIMEREILSLAAVKGAKILTKTSAIKIIGDKEKFTAVLVEHKKGKSELKCEYIALACGMDKRVANSAGININVKESDIISSAQYLIAGNDFELGYPEFHLGNRIAPGGYAWIFPKGDNIANVGIGVALDRLNGKMAVQYLDEFIKNKFKGKIEILERTGGVVPVGGPAKKLVYKNLLLLGDAGMLTDPLSGGGIANALLSGKLAAYAIYDTKNGKHLLNEYEKNFFKLKRKELEFHLIARRILVTLTDDELNELGEIVAELYGGKSFTEIDSIRFLIDVFTRHPKIFGLVRKIIPAFLK